MLVYKVDKSKSECEGKETARWKVQVATFPVMGTGPLHRTCMVGIKIATVLGIRSTRDCEDTEEARYERPEVDRQRKLWHPYPGSK